MKLIVSGATGLLGTEVIRQSLSNPKITSVLALTRRPVSVPTNLGKEADASKLKNLVLEDFTKYPDDVKKELGDADACIWTLALTPMKSRSFPWEEIVRVNKDYCLAGLEAISEAREAASSKKTFRYVYVAGDGVPKEGEKPSYMPGLQDYLKLRASTSYTVLAHSRTHNDPDFQTTVAKPGVISRPGEWRNYFITGLSLIGIPKIEVSECAAAMLQQCLDGFEKDDLPNADLVRLGRKALEETKT